MPEILGIENANFEFPWDEADFVHCLRERNVIGLTAEHGERVCGYIIYELQKGRIVIINMAIHASCQRRGIGRAIIGKLASKLRLGHRTRLVAKVRESNLDAQLFFRALGFRATGLERDLYEDSPEDAYVFEYQLEGGA